MNAAADSSKDGFQNFVLLEVLADEFFICVFVGIKYGNNGSLIISDTMKSKQKFVFIKYKKLK